MLNIELILNSLNQFKCQQVAYVRDFITNVGNLQVLQVLIYTCNNNLFVT